MNDEEMQAAIANAMQDVDNWLELNEPGCRDLEYDALLQRAKEVANGYKELMVGEELDVYIKTYIYYYRRLNTYD